ncbi:hypothetical protein Patl1_17520 [Pistacia atlantica]|uniref:Uncharacterized protein n=1 Tax=Pistacia atlantica TaxID=434234 RepID=A0ACC1C0I1_9ROSI|nr:hypothetical protein Patl1_17520 [Pistacia atlantica]
MGGGQALKRIPRIKFPQRNTKPSDSANATQSQSASSSVDAFFTSFFKFKGACVCWRESFSSAETNSGIQRGN